MAVMEEMIFTAEKLPPKHGQAMLLSTGRGGGAEQRAIPAMSRADRV